MDARRSIEAIWRIECPRLVASLTRLLRDVGVAEEVAQDAFVAALEQWPRDGVPDRPGAWLMATARNRAIDRIRRERGRDERYALLAEPAIEDAHAPEAIGDDLLALVFVTCHPVLPRESRVALTLRLLGGLSTEEVARAFLVPSPAIGQRISRAKRTLAEAHVPFEVPQEDELPERLAAVLEVVYLVFNEGYSASSGEAWIRRDLGREAMRLGRVLAGLLPRAPEVHGLVALMELQASRFGARTAPDGSPVLLPDQDRTRWDRTLMTHGLAALDRAVALRRPLGPYTVQAAIAACHARARSFEETDWEAIVALYDALAQLTPSPIVELNRAIAVLHAEGPEAALAALDAIAGDPRLARYHLLGATRADVLRRLGRDAEADEELRRAAALAPTARERDLLLSRTGDRAATDDAGHENGSEAPVDSWGLRPGPRAARLAPCAPTRSRVLPPREPGPLGRRSPLSRSAAEQAALIRDGRLRARELVDAALEAIERDEHNAFVLTCPERARAEADAIGPGDERPFAGVPIAIKDLIVLTEGLRTTNASRSLGDFTPAVDSAPVAALRAAGAIVVGKTNTPEWGMRPVAEPERYGPARNPHDPSLITGGSSGGSAAAVAAGLVALAHGNDAGGSVRIPASCCGVVGLKPTRFRVPLGPELQAFEGTITEGVLTRSVFDAALALDVMAGEGPSTPLGPPLPRPSFAEAALTPPHALRIRLCTRPPGGEEVEPECVAAAHHAAGVLQALGHEVDEWAPDWTDPTFAEHWARAGAAMFRALIERFGELAGAPLDPERMEPATRELLRAPAPAPEAVREATEGLKAFALRVLGSWRPGSILLTPTLTLLPRPVGSVGPELGTRFSAFLRPFNVTGQPAISLPLHRTHDGVPVGVQLAGPAGSEARLLSLAGQLEAAGKAGPGGRFP